MRISPLISIVMPTYNQAQYIAKAVTSVLAQTYNNWELIVVDNFSTDETINVLKEFSDMRIEVLQINNEGSIARSRNLGIVRAQADWIAFLDSDDYWYPDKLEKVSSFLNIEHDLIYHHLGLINGSINNSHLDGIWSRKLKAPILKDLLLNGNTIATSSVVVRKKCLINIGGMNESPHLAGTEDYNSWLRMSLITEKFTLVPLKLGMYRKHSTNLSNSNYFEPPSTAIEEFLPLLMPFEIRRVKESFEYIKVRTLYLNGQHNGLKKDLWRIISKGSFFHKLKASWMILNLVRRGN